jgi:hypothetical protein
MNKPSNPVERWKHDLATGHSVVWLKTAIVLWAIGITLFAVFFVDNKVILAGILLYEVLP